MINELLDRDSVTPRLARIRTPDGQRQLVYYLVVLGLSQHQGNQVNDLARAFDLFLTDRPELESSCAAYTDLPALCERASGLDPHKLWGILFAFLAHFYSIDASNAHDRPATISRSQYFADYDFKPEEIDRFFGLVAQDMSALQIDMAARYSLFDMRVYDILPIASRPLVTDGTLTYCPLLRPLVRKMTSGLYHILFNACTGTDRDRLPQYIGDVFQYYVHRMMLRIYEASHRVRYIDEANLAGALETKKGQTPRRCDGLLIYEDAVILLETKAKLFPADVRAGANIDLFFDRFDEIFLRGSQQIDATIEHIRTGALKSIGLLPNRIRHFYPVIISLQEITMRPQINDYISQQLSARNLLQSQGTRPLQLLTANEMEILEIGLSETADFRGVLDRKLADDWGRQMGFGDYMAYRNDPPSKAQHNQYLSGLYLELSKTAAAFFASRTEKEDRQG